jgi:predicted RNase H-like HicB family nuclease
LANIREAISCHLEALRADGLPLPPPRASIESVATNEAA